MRKDRGLQCYPPVFGQFFLESYWWEEFDRFSQLRMPTSYWPEDLQISLRLELTFAYFCTLMNHMPIYIGYQPRHSTENKRSSNEKENRLLIYQHKRTDINYRHVFRINCRKLVYYQYKNPGSL